MEKPSYEELAELLARLEKQQLKGLQFRVAERGGMSVYGLGRFPVTLYYEQWIKLLGAADDIRAFLEENKTKLKMKAKEE